MTVRPTILAAGLLAALLVLNFAEFSQATVDEKAAESLSTFSRAYRTLLSDSAREWIYPKRILLQDALIQPFGRVFTSLWFYLFVIAAFVLERFIPADKEQQMFSVGMIQDFVWFLSALTLTSVCIAGYTALLTFVYQEYFAFLTIAAVGGWPVFLRWGVSLLAIDFLLWLSHYFRHRIKVFWYFHLVHHSQSHLNFFTEDRSHPGEKLISLSVRFLPMAMFSLSFPQSVYLGMFLTWYTRFYHANLRTNYGIFKYVLVTPQSHRIHHSIEEKHWGKNLGTYFTIWDRMFGTLCSNYDEYPATGIGDQTFPLEQNVRGIFSNYWHQLLYPFRLLLLRPTAALQGATMSIWR